MVVKKRDTYELERYCLLDVVRSWIAFNRCRRQSLSPPAEHNDSLLMCYYLAMELNLRILHTSVKTFLYGERREEAGTQLNDSRAGSISHEILNVFRRKGTRRCTFKKCITAGTTSRTDVV